MNVKGILRKRIIEIVLPNKRFSVKNSIIIFSSPRSGSTWLSEILNHLPKTFINWEPLHDIKGIIPQEFAWGHYPSIPPDLQDPNVHNFLEDLLTVQRYNNWTLRYSSIPEIALSSNVLTKFIRANQIAPYICANFELQFKPIYLIRHPIDSAISQINSFKHIKRLFNIAYYTQGNFTEAYKNYFNYLNTLESILEKMVGIWLINNIGTIQKLKEQGSVTFVLYYDLLQNTTDEISRVFKSLAKEEYTSSILHKTNLNQLSKSSPKSEILDSPEKNLNKNIAKLDKHQKEKIQKVLDYFEFDLFNAYSPEPNRSFLE